MTLSSAFVCGSAIGASIFGLQGCNSNSDVDCDEAYRKGCYDYVPFNSCCHDCDGGSGGRSCSVKQTHTNADKTTYTLNLNFQYGIDDQSCNTACAYLKQADWHAFCDGCDNCVKDNSDVQKCNGVLDQINQQTDGFCVKGSSFSVTKGEAFSVAEGESFSVAKGNETADYCKKAYYAKCWDEKPFNEGCCVKCDASAGKETCRWSPHRTEDGGDIQLNITFPYDPTDDNCKDACEEISNAIPDDYCGGKHPLDKNNNVKHCDAAMEKIHEQLTSHPAWCPSSVSVQTV